MLLNSEINITVVGKFGWDIHNGLCTLNDTDQGKSTVARGDVCDAIGSVFHVLILENKTIVLSVLVVSSLPQT